MPFWRSCFHRNMRSCAQKAEEEALQILEQERDGFSLVLLDVMMPGMNGYEVLEYMNFNGMLKRTPVYHGNGS